MLLIVVWTVLWASQAYAACCGPNSGSHNESMNSVMEMHAIVRSDHHGCNEPQEPCCPQMLDENLPIAGVHAAIVHDGRLAQPVLLQRAPLLVFEQPRAGNDRIPDSLDPPDRVYLRLQRFLI